MKKKKTVSKHGNSSKPISVYANAELLNPVKSSTAGLKINISNFTLTVSLGLDNIGISGSVTKGNTVDSFGMRVNVSELKIGFEGSTAVTWDNETEIAYANASVSGWFLVVAYQLVTTGQLSPTPSYGY